MDRPWLFATAAAASPKPITIVAWVIAALAAFVYVLLLLIALLRVGGQYGPAMRGKFGLRVAAVMSEAGRRWYVFVIGAVALAIALLAH